jgi:hypothetical protein
VADSTKPRDVQRFGVIRVVSLSVGCPTNNTSPALQLAARDTGTYNCAGSDFLKF